MAEKYLNIAKAEKLWLDEQRGAFFELPLAKEDLARNKIRSTTSNNKTIGTILKKAKQAAKVVKVLHDAGYSHNDIKPQNLLRIDKWNSNLGKITMQKELLKDIKNILDNNTTNEKMTLDTLRTIELKAKAGGFKKILDIIKNKDTNIEKLNKIKEYANNKHISKYNVQLCDFGSITKLKSLKPGLGTQLYCCQGETYKSEKEFAKRDVFALGMTFIYLLFECTGITENSVTEIEEIKNNLQKENYIGEFFKGGHSNILEIYGGTSKENISNFLFLIKEMTKPLNNRISLDEVLRKLNSIKSDKN